jgi:hypothetical protein
LAEQERAAAAAVVERVSHAPPTAGDQTRFFTAVENREHPTTVEVKQTA